MARIAFFAKWALEYAMSRRHLEDTLFLHDHRRDWYVFGVWIPKLSGTRRWTASHCVFRRFRTSKTRCHDVTSKIPCFDTITVESAFFLCLD